ncbi:39S ribosomal protein L39, mitochondrial-like [Mya arenaria]|uniref:39S ribosomal protein L39, mitochondrial-like n=1 Tax=Mya arenaria TaxID=6604 RepID=UPI0022E1B5DE|nr:39S ribosomal protein L39, mitochondrial-like [Mya arenaria]
MLIKRFCTLCMKSAVDISNQGSKRFYSASTKLTNTEVRKKRNAIFDEEKQRQREAFVKRVEKITVDYSGPPENVTLLMNKDISTPYNCAMHVHEYLMKRSVVALVNGQPWDMHRPLEENCSLEFKHMLEVDTKLVNEVFWRSGAFALGHVLETAFKDDVYVELCSFPKVPVQYGCFAYDVDLKLPDWKPTQRELTGLGMVGGRLWGHNWDIERLDVDASVALKMFADNRFKSDQIPDIAAKSDHNRVIIYRMGDHIDITKGPLIANTSQFYRFQVTAIHQISSQRYGSLQRVQAIALPSALMMHWWSWELLCERAAKPMMYMLPDAFLKPKQEEIDDKEGDRLVSSTSSS